MRVDSGGHAGVISQGGVCRTQWMLNLTISANCCRARDTKV